MRYAAEAQCDARRTALESGELEALPHAKVLPGDVATVTVDQPRGHRAAGIARSPVERELVVGVRSPVSDFDHQIIGKAS